MKSMIARRPSPAMLVAVAALLTAVVGSGYASGGDATRSALRVEGVRAVSEETPSSTEASKQVTARCPRGLKVLGGGAQILATPSEPGRSLGIALEQSRPTPDDAKQPKGWLAAAGAGPMAPGSWSLRAHAICGG